MTTSGESGNRDPAWKYCFPLEGNKNGTRCKFCNLVLQGGGITPFKFHLIDTDPRKNSKKCEKVPPEVRTEIIDWIQKKDAAKKKKSIVEENIRNELRGNLGKNQTQFDNEYDSDDDMYMYPADMNIEEREEYRAAVQESKKAEWQRQQNASLFGNTSKRGSSSRAGATTEPLGKLRQSKSVRISCPDPPLAPSFYKSSSAKQKRIKHMFGGNFKESLGRLVSKFFIYENVAPNKAKSHHFKNMLAGAQEMGM